MSTDPFHHHPGLRDKIKPAEQSFFRDFMPKGCSAIFTEQRAALSHL
jgi:hypothetical protein